MTENNKTKEKRYVIEASEELMQILEIIKGNVKEYTWGAQDNVSNFVASKILAKRVRKANLY